MTPTSSPQPRQFPQQEIAGIETELSALDREPPSIETLLKAVRRIARAFDLPVQEIISPRGAQQLKCGRTIYTIQISPDGRHYEGSYLDPMDGINDYHGMTASKLAWMICGHPNRLIR